MTVDTVSYKNRWLLQVPLSCLPEGIDFLCDRRWSSEIVFCSHPWVLVMHVRPVSQVKFIAKILICYWYNKNSVFIEYGYRVTPVAASFYGDMFMLEQSCSNTVTFFLPDCLAVRVFKLSWVPTKCYKLPLACFFCLCFKKFPVNCRAKIVCLREFCKRALGYLFCHEHSKASLFCLKSIVLLSVLRIFLSLEKPFLLEQ